MNKAELIKKIAELLTEKMIIGENPTNGDVIKAVFPHCPFRERIAYDKSDHVIFDLNGFYMRVSDDCWNAPYEGVIGNADSN